MKNLLQISLLFFFVNACSQNKKLENRTVVHYFKEVNALEYKERNRLGLTLDSITIAPEYRDSVTQKMNYRGGILLNEIKDKIVHKYFEDYLFLQQIEHDKTTYQLYFTSLTSADVEFIVLENKARIKDIPERINRKSVSVDSKVMKLNWHMNEAPRMKLDQVTIFVKNDYLVFDLGGLYLSAYHLKTKKLLYKEENPFRINQMYTKKANDKWVLENVHQKIEKLID